MIVIFYIQAHDGMTVLHLAAKSGRLAVVQSLLENNKMDINAKVATTCQLSFRLI